eukprot:g251.t1
MAPALTWVLGHFTHQRREESSNSKTAMIPLKGLFHLLEWTSSNFHSDHPKHGSLPELPEGEHETLQLIQAFKEGAASVEKNRNRLRSQSEESEDELREAVDHADHALIDGSSPRSLKLETIVNFFSAYVSQTHAERGQRRKIHGHDSFPTKVDNLMHAWETIAMDYDKSKPNRGMLPFSHSAMSMMIMTSASVVNLVKPKKNCCVVQ